MSSTCKSNLSSMAEARFRPNQSNMYRHQPLKINYQRSTLNELYRKGIDALKNTTTAGRDDASLMDKHLNNIESKVTGGCLQCSTTASLRKF